MQLERLQTTAIGKIENDIEAFMSAINGDVLDLRRNLSRLGTRLNEQKAEAEQHTDNAEKKLLTKFDDLHYRVEKLAVNVTKLAEGASSIDNSIGRMPPAPVQVAAPLVPERASTAELKDEKGTPSPAATPGEPKSPADPTPTRIKKKDKVAMTQEQLNQIYETINSVQQNLTS